MPEATQYLGNSEHIDVPPARTERMFTPGAATSTSSPQLEKLAFTSLQSVAATVIIYDNTLAWAPWVCANRKYFEFKPYYALFWQIITDCIKKKITIFDFGRSTYLNNNYKFKIQWGAYPVKICNLTNSKAKITGKYKLASFIWKKLPTKLTDFIGPKLAKYVLDL